MAACVAASASGVSAPCASARRAARPACRGPSTAGRRGRGRRPRAPAARRRRPCGPPRTRRPCARSCARAPARARDAARRRRRGPRRASGRPGGSSCRRGPRRGRARARRAAARAARATAMAARDCGMNSPCSHSGEPKASNGASSTRPSGSRSAGRAGTGSSSCVVFSVLMRSAASAGSFPAAISARASPGPSASNHSSAIQRDTSAGAPPRRAWRRAGPRSARAPRGRRGAGRR